MENNITTANTLQDWSNCKKIVEDYLKNGQIAKNEEMVVNVSIEGDIENLIYFFPIADMLDNYGIKSTLDVTINNAAVDPNRLLIQTKHFLFLQQTLGTNTTIKINGSGLSFQTRFGRVQPLIAVKYSKDSPFAYNKIFSSEISADLLLQLKKYLLKDFYGTERLTPTEWEEIKQIIEPVSHLSQKPFIEENKTYFSENKPMHLNWSELFYINDTDNINHILSKLTYSNLFYTLQFLRGTNENNLSQNIKFEIADNLIENLVMILRDLHVLTQYIWSVLLRFLFESKEFIKKNKDEEQLYYKSLFDISLNQAEALSDGLFQLIENACLYSKSNSAYFYLRVHNTRFRNLPNDSGTVKSNTFFGEMGRHVDKLIQLSNAYEPYKMDADIPFYLEICFVDNASNLDGTTGMTEHFEKTHSGTVSGLKDIFRYSPKMKNDLIIHYGLRVFERTVIMNKGTFLVTTPLGKRKMIQTEAGKKQIHGYSYQSVANSSLDNYIIQGPCYSGTIYKILIPIQNEWIMEIQKSEDPPHNLFDLTDIQNEILPFRITLKITSEIEREPAKIKKISMLSNQMADKLSEITKLQYSGPERIICIYPEDFKTEQIEILAKAIVAYLLNRQNKKNRMAILLNKKNHISEFTRTFTAFFDISGSGYEQFELTDTQIALCKKRDKTGDSGTADTLYDVCFVLSGNHLAAAQRSVRNYLYFNADTSIEFLPLVNYMTAFIENNYPTPSPHTLFPFDLYLDLESFENYDNKKTSLIEDNIWFYKHIMHLLNTDMQQNGEGCKIENVHVSIGSRIHIDTFYNAELLFHNYAVVFRFAYIIARTVLSEQKAMLSVSGKKLTEKKIVMVAYGEYSLILIQKICDILRQTEGVDANYILFPSYLNEEEMSDWQSYGKELVPFFEKENIKCQNNLDDYIFYILVPISSTLSTVQRIQDVIKRQCALENLGEPQFGINTSLIVVGGIEDKRGITLNYWEDINKSRKTIFLYDLDKNSDNSSSKIVKYYFNTYGKWYKAAKISDEQQSGCELCQQSTSPVKSLIGVDKTSTLPDVILDSLYSLKKNFITSNKVNNERIQKLYGYVTYSHICHDKNHFLYDIDYEGFSKNPEVNDSIIEWLKSSVRTQIDINAFNIIVSPLNSSNSVFLKNVIEQAFENNGRIINIKFHTAYRDEIRSKFKYISKEYNALKNKIHGAKVNVYFVDNCIIEGSTFQRSKQFMYMLLADSGFDMKTVTLFKGIILLSNRSSYDTIQNLLPGHVEDRFFYYMRLNVPSFNTKNRICPACALSKQYLLMRKRASTSVIASEYQRLYKKHIVKTSFEYQKWQNKQLYRTAYTDRFSSWLYYSVFYDEKSKQFLYSNIIGDKIPLLGESGCIRSLNEEDIQKIFNNSKGLSNLLNDDTLGKQFNADKVNVQKKIISFDKNFIRMICTHKVFMKYETAHNEAVERKLSAESFEILIREELLGLLHDSIKEINKQKLPAKVSLWLKSEWIISYIKIMSRKQPAQYYQLRNAIFNILLDMMNYLLLNKTGKTDIEFLADLCAVNPNQKQTDSIMPDMKFKIFLIVIRRISAMHSSYLIENLKSIMDYYYECKKQYDGVEKYVKFYESETAKNIYQNLICFPGVYNLNFNVSRLIKWSSMNGMDESKCYFIEKILSDKLKMYEKKANKEAESSEMIDAIQIAFLENTQVIYHGIKKLILHYNGKFSDWKQVFNYVSSIVNDKSNQTIEMSPFKSILDFINIPFKHKGWEEKSMCIRLTNMIMLFVKLCELETSETRITSPYDYVNICNYIRDILDYNKCEIVSVKEHKITVIASSDIYSDYLLNGDLNNEIVDDAISYFNTKAKNTLLSQVAQKFIINEITELLIVPLLSIDSVDNDDFVPEFYMVLCRNNIVQGSPQPARLTHNDLWNLRNVLFLRDRLEIDLKEDIAYLCDMVSSYGYIKPLVPNRHPVILHISDIHVHTNSDEVAELKEKTKYAIMNEVNFSEYKPDLLLITGDVITGDYTAIGIKRSYEKAENIIKHLVKSIWGKQIGDNCYVESDWKKRVLISVGNHDYASMNELEAHNSRRATTSGTPGVLGDNMVKHSYFLNFIHNLLGNEIDELVMYDINRIVNYRQLGLSVVNLNTNSNVNPLRTNKVRVNGKEVTKMFSHNNVEKTLVYMMHHTPMYDIDYINDIYYLTYRMVESISKNIHSFGIPGFECDYNSINCLWIRLIKSLVNNFKNDVYGKTEEEQKKLMKDIIQVLKKNHYKEYDDKGLDEFEYFIACDNTDMDDKCRHIKSNLEEQLIATEKDTKEFADFIITHFNDVMYSEGRNEVQAFYILGGHTHVAARSSVEMKGVMSKCHGIFEAGKFLKISEDKVDLSYNLISVNIDADSADFGNTEPLLACGYKEIMNKNYDNDNCKMLRDIINSNDTPVEAHDI